MLGRVGDIFRLYGELMAAARDSKEQPGVRQQFDIGSLTRQFEHLLDIDVAVDDVTVLTPQLRVELLLQLPALSLGLLDGAVVSAGPGDLAVTATMTAAGHEAYSRSGSVALSRLLELDADLRLYPALPRQAPAGSERTDPR